MSRSAPAKSCSGGGARCTNCALQTGLTDVHPRPSARVSVVGVGAAPTSLYFFKRTSPPPFIAFIAPFFLPPPPPSLSPPPLSLPPSSFRVHLPAVHATFISNLRVRVRCWVQKQDPPQLESALLLSSSPSHAPPPGRSSAQFCSSSHRARMILVRSSSSREPSDWMKRRKFIPCSKFFCWYMSVLGATRHCTARNAR